MDVGTVFNAAQAHRQAGRWSEAERGYRAIVAELDHLPSLHNLGVLLDMTGRRLEAGEVFRRAAEAGSGQPHALAAYANHLREVRRFEESERLWRKVLALDPVYPEAAFILGNVLLAQGKFEEGWRLYQQRALREVPAQTLGNPEWRGEPLTGKRLFVWREQGFGDQIMMARFLPRLGAKEVIYAGPPPLRRLFEPLGLTWLDVDPSGRVSAPAADFWTMPMSLPLWLGATPDAGGSSPYLFAQPRPTGGRIGVVWRGSSANRNDPFRSLPAEQGARLLALPGAISLEPEDTGATDFQDTADIIAGLDLVITVDTAMAHLAGALGRPVWVLLARHALDWHWPREGVSPWYPSARLFCQDERCAWEPLVDRVIREATA